MKRLPTLFLILAFATTALTQGTFQGVGDLAGAEFESKVNGVSADGNVAVGYSKGTSTLAFRWTQAGGMVALPDLPGGITESIGIGCSGDGSVVVGTSYGTNGQEAFRWTQPGGMVGLGDLAGGQFASAAFKVSDDGQFICGQSHTGEWQGFRWSAATGLVSCGTLPGATAASNSVGISPDGGTVVGHARSTTGFEAFRWTPATGMVTMGDLPGGTVTASGNDISRNGLIVAGDSDAAGGWVATVWTQASGLFSIGDLSGGAADSRAWAVSDNGTVVGFGTTANGQEAFIWTQGSGMQRLRTYLEARGVTGMNNWVIRDALDISADGSTIVGWGTNPNGQTEGFVAKLTPGQVSPREYVVQWGDTLTNPDRDTSARNVALDPQGNIVTCGPYARSAADQDWIIRKYTAEGFILWTRFFDNGPQLLDTPREIVTDPAGNIYVAGSGTGANPAAGEAVVVKYGPNGNVLYTSRINQNQNNTADSAFDIAVDAIGNVCVTGQGNGADILTYKLDSNGAELWRATKDGPGAKQDEARSIALDVNGNTYITGRVTLANDDTDLAAIKYNSGGGEVWYQRYSSTFVDNAGAQASALAADGNLVVTGSAKDVDGEQKVLAAKYNALSGATMWKTLVGFNDPAQEVLTARDISLGLRGRIFISGDGTFDGVSYMLALQLSPDGAPVKLFKDKSLAAGSVPNRMNAVIADSCGAATFAGMLGSAANNTADWSLLRKGDVPSQEGWFLANGPGNAADEAFDVAIDANDDLVVAGTLRGATNQLLHLVKYRQKVGTTPDSYTATAGSNLVINAAEGVFANDPGSKGAVAVVVTSGWEGSVTLGTKGSFTYQPDPGFVGQDSFTYRAQKTGTATSADAVATLFVANAPPALTSFTITPVSVMGGTPAVGKVTLSLPTQATMSVALQSSSSSIVVQAAIPVAKHQLSAQFAVHTQPVTATYSRTVTASLNGVQKVASLQLRPAISLTLDPVTVDSGQSTTATLALGFNAGNAGMQVAITDNSSAILTPSTVTLPLGTSTIQFSVGTTSVATQATRTVTATFGALTRNASLTLKPAAGLSSLGVSPSSVKGGQGATGTVTLTAPAPSPITVTLSDNSSVITVPANTLIPQGSSVTQFTITTSTVTATVTRLVTATYNGVTKSATLTLTP